MDYLHNITIVISLFDLILLLLVCRWLRHGVEIFGCIIRIVLRGEDGGGAAGLSVRRTVRSGSVRGFGMLLCPSFMWFRGFDCYYYMVIRKYWRLYAFVGNCVRPLSAIFEIFIIPIVLWYPLMINSSKTKKYFW